MRVLVTGGTGYIGSHTVLSLVADGHEALVVDDYRNSKPSVVGRLESLAGRELQHVELDLTDAPATSDLFRRHAIDAVIHFAGLKAVGQSVEQPLAYYDDNLRSTLALLSAMAANGVQRFVFSSSATVYGDRAPVPYQEDYVPLSAASPYGRTKVMIEQILTDVAAASDLKVALLRYFNPVGAHPSGDIGEDPLGVPNNLVPFIAQVAVGRRPLLKVFGDDYPTADGTCERDYIHVQELADGHVLALDHLDDMVDRARVYNLGTGRATSVMTIIKTFERVTGRPIPYEVTGRRSGDLPAFWADSSRARSELGWKASKTVEDMIEDAWRWQQQNPTGFPE